MGKNKWMALALAAVILLTSAPSVFAAVRQGSGIWTRGNSIIRQTEDDGGGTASSEESGDSGDMDAGGSAEEMPEAGVFLNTASHDAYLYGSGGTALPAFHPTRQVTRAEAAQMLYRLLPPNTPVSNTSYSDVPENAFYAEAVKTLAGLGVMSAVDGKLDTGAEVSRGEFVRYIASFFPLRTDAELFYDVPESDPNAPYIRSARAYGWTQGGSDGLFKPDESINRAAAVVMLNRALGRTPDKTYINAYHPTFFIDVQPSSWYYYDVCEATVSHRHTEGAMLNETGDAAVDSAENTAERWTSHTARTAAYKEGLQMADGWLFCYDSARGDVVRNASVGNFTFDASGHFTSGNNELDAWLHEIVLNHTDPAQTQEEMLRSLFVWTRDSFTYLRRPPYEFGVLDFMETDALRILTTGYGNCYCYASLYWYLTRWIGYDSVIYSGTVGQNRAPHSWVEINMDGKNYIFDTELEMAYRKKKRFDINLYKFYDAKNSWNYRRSQS